MKPTIFLALILSILTATSMPVRQPVAHKADDHDRGQSDADSLGNPCGRQPPLWKGRPDPKIYGPHNHIPATEEYRDEVCEQIPYLPLCHRRASGAWLENIIPARRPFTPAYFKDGGWCFLGSS